MLTENHIIDLLEVYFQKDDCEVKKVSTKQKGIDMIVTSKEGKLLI